MASGKAKTTAEKQLTKDPTEEEIRQDAFIAAAVRIGDHSKNLFHVADAGFKCGIELHGIKEAIRGQNDTLWRMNQNLDAASTALVALAVEGFFVAAAAIGVLVAIFIG